VVQRNRRKKSCVCTYLHQSGKRCSEAKSKLPPNPVFHFTLNKTLKSLKKVKDIPSHVYFHSHRSCSSKNLTRVQLSVGLSQGVLIIRACFHSLHCSVISIFNETYLESLASRPSPTCQKKKKFVCIYLYRGGKRASEAKSKLPPNPVFHFTLNKHLESLKKVKYILDLMSIFILTDSVHRKF
jgi:hypothetical protein